MARRTPATRTRRPTPSARAPRAPSAPANAADPPSSRPDVYVDFSVRRGLLFVTVHNIGTASAYHVVTSFDRPLRGLGGRRDLATLALFRSLLFLPPGKRISQLVDAADTWFRRETSTRLTATLTYTDRDGRRYTESVPHDLAVYRDLAEPLPRAPHPPERT